MKAKLGWRFLLACLVPMSLVPILRPRDGVASATLQLVRGELQRASATGWPLELIAADGTAEELRARGAKLASARGRTSHLLHSAEAVLFVPSAEFLALPRPARWQEYGKWLAAATTLKDLDGTLRTITWVYLATLINAKQIDPLPPPAPLPYLAAPTVIESPAASVDWGLPVALLIALALSALQAKLAAQPSPPQEEGELAELRTGPVVDSQKAN